MSADNGPSLETQVACVASLVANISELNERLAWIGRQCANRREWATRDDLLDAIEHFAKAEGQS